MGMTHKHCKCVILPCVCGKHIAPYYGGPKMTLQLNLCVFMTYFPKGQCSNQNNEK